MLISHPKILVVGGAGYIGSHMMLALMDAGYQPIAFDNLSTGHRDAVQGALVIGDLADKALLERLFSLHDFGAVMHFASLIEVAESVRQPNRYYQNNVAGTLNLLEAMLNANVKKIIFSSSAAVYGEPEYVPINEAHPQNPITPYGRSKKMIEEIIQDHVASDKLQYAILRYYNAAGADPKARAYERHSPESHLIPLALNAALNETAITIFGDDYATKDGTCVRDYVHVNDICQAHLQALRALSEGDAEIICNLGLGHGYSVNDIINSVKRITQRQFGIIKGARRIGDPAILIADSTRAKRVLNWQPQYIELDQIIEHSWQAMQRTRVTT